MAKVSFSAALSMIITTAMIIAVTAEASGTNALLFGAAAMASMWLQMWYTMEACDPTNEPQEQARSKITACVLHTMTTVGVCTELYRDFPEDNGFFICTYGFISLVIGFFLYGKLRNYKTESERLPV